MYLNWDWTLDIGIESIDNQHMELVNRLDQLLTSVEEGKGHDEVINTLNFLEEYVVKHFDEEEELQKKINYPLFEIQHAQHEEFKNELKNFRKTFETQGASEALVINIQEKLVDWFRNHIINLDKDLGDYLIENGYNI
ncbi:bacteriohemerythrin [Clostridium sp. C2-6-12]|uniref:bacteriohemerythrin n=1 Tax=Clostridium sp. C2-6-12 TaxID=2698832 RepID=UPI0013680CC2|nr:bacteriohemerythrin [Clostridium sp. C2-6-12]